MKNNWKHALIAFAAVLGIGLVMAGIGGALGGRPTSDNQIFHFSFSRLFGAGDDEASSAVGASLHAPAAPEAPSAPAAPDAPAAPQAPTASAHKLEVDIGAGQVSIVPGDSFSMTSNKDGVVSARLDGGTYKVENSGNRWTGNLEVTITVPQDVVLEEADLTISAGQMSVNGLACETAELEVGAGQMTLSDFSCTRGAEISLGAGHLALTGEMAGEIDVTCDAGQVRLTLARPADFGYHVDCAMGTVKIGEQGRISGLSSELTENEGADTFFDVECGVGAVKIEFV